MISFYPFSQWLLRPLPGLAASGRLACLLLAGLLTLTPGYGQRLAAGLRHTVAVYNDGTLRAWGDNSWG